MSAIVALDEITEQLGPPVCLRLVEAPRGAIAAVARFRHKGGLVDFTASGNFRLIFQVTGSEVEIRRGDERATRRISRVGNIITSFTLDRERVRILGGADTLHFFFSPKLTEEVQADPAYRPSAAAAPALRACAVQALVGVAQYGTESHLERAVISVARILVQDRSRARTSLGGLTPQARRAIHEVLDERLGQGITVPQLAEVAGLSLHHFIKVCRATEGYTPHTVLLHKRLERAIALLSNHRARVDEVAITTGFSSPSHFISVFRNLMGVTPAAFRNAVSV